MQLPLKYHGGKNYLASKIRALFPKHTHYVEPYFGGGAVLLSGDGAGVSEVANDIDQRLTNFWRVLQAGDLRRGLVDLIEHTPVSEEEWQRAFDHFDAHACPTCSVGLLPCVHCAWKFFVLCRQSMAGRMHCFTPRTRTRLRRGMNGETSAWWSAAESLEQAGDRLSRVVILNRGALGVIAAEDRPDTLFYCDPPYLHQTRATTKDYKHEMTEQDHKGLLALLRTTVGKVVISGYPSQLYDVMLNGWTRVEFKLPNHAASGELKRRMTECVWINYSLTEVIDLEDLRNGPGREPEGATGAGRSDPA